MPWIILISLCAAACSCFSLAASDDESYLIVRGGLLEDDRIFVTPCFLSDTPQHELLAPMETGPYEILLKNDKGKMVQTYGFGFETARVSMDRDDKALSGRDFAFSIPCPPHIREICIQKMGEVLWKKRRSPHLPEVKITTPQPNETLSSSTITLQWTGRDRDNDTLFYIVEYFNPGLKAWEPITSLIRSSRLTIDKNLLSIPLSNTPATIRVVCTDGFNTARSQVSFMLQQPIQ